MTITQVTARDALLDFARGAGDPVIVSPIYSEVLPRQRAGLDWTVDQADPRMTEAKLRVGEDAGFPPILKFEVGSLGFLSPREEVLEDAGDRQVVRQSFEAQDGVLEAVYTRMANGTHVTKKMIQSIGDTLKMAWVWENRGDFQAMAANLRRHVEQVGSRGLVCLNISHPFGSFDDKVTDIFFSMEHPAQMREVADRMCEVRKKWIDLASEAGVRCFFAGAMGMNMYSPDMIDQWMVPYCIELREHIHRRGGIYYLHECGSMKHKLARGVYEKILPDWLEGWEAPPVGDIENLAEARRQLPPEIVLKGNLNLEFLEAASPAQVEARTLAMLESVRGYRHIVGGACSLLAKTPHENLKALVGATRRFLGQRPKETA